MHINGINYFIHIFSHEYPTKLPNTIQLINLLEKEQKNINTIYIYTRYGISESAQPLLEILQKLNLLDKICHVNIIEENNGEYLDPNDTKFKVGISNERPWVYE